MRESSLLRVRELSVSFPTGRGTVSAVRSLSYDVAPGEALGIVGESGSGKSTQAYAVLGLLRAPGRVDVGSVLFEGRELLGLDRRALERLRGDGISMIFQDPLSCLDPAFRVGSQLTEALRAHREVSPAEAERRALDVLRAAGVADGARLMKQYPFELSGGLRQRVMIALALLCAPKLLIADEPTTALDVTVQAGIIRRLRALRAEQHTAMVFITHNFGLVAELCDRVLVMYGGCAVERGTVDELFRAPLHPYARALLAAMPRMSAPRTQPLIPIEGAPVDPLDPPAGCPFHPRCAEATARCRAEQPPERTWDDGRAAACWRLWEETTDE